MEVRAPSPPPEPPRRRLPPSPLGAPPLDPLPPTPPPTSPPKPLPLPPALQNKSTYVVHVARDQVYRVPPPENAYLVEQYLKRPKQSQGCRGAPCFTCISWILALLLVLILIIAGVVVAFFAMARPGAPHVSIDRMRIKEHGRNSKPKYDLTLKIRNPSSHMGYLYLKGGTAALSLGSSSIATTKPPSFKQDAKESSTIKLSLRGNKAAIPLAIKKGVKSKKPTPRGGIAMRLSMKYDVKGRIGFVDTWIMKVEVNCKLRIRVSIKGSEVMDQHCDVKLH